MATERKSGNTKAWTGSIDVDPELAARVDDLAVRVQKHRALYYAGKPEISDAAFDALEEELRELDPTHPVLAQVGPAALVTEWEKARHMIPMGSLNKVVNEEELLAWVERCDELLAKEGLGSIKNDLFVAEKLDGLSIELVYDGGKFKDAITRGRDGIEGERITPNVARMKGVPARIDDTRALSVRGEIILRLTDMKQHFPPTRTSLYTSPRNTAAGAARHLKGERNEHLSVVCFDIADHLELGTEVDKFEYIRKLGFVLPNVARGTLDDVLALYHRYGADRRATLDYEIDGLVVYANSMHAQSVLGEVNRRPRGAIAFKFTSPQKVTRVKDVLWDTGPSGRVTPVAVVEPVVLAGAKVQRASLHNAANVRRLGIGAGDEVLVSRRNDVIPYVEEVVEKKGAPSEPPTKCPVCGSKLFVEGEYLMCRNDECPAVVEGRIKNWIKAIKALGWGEEIIGRLVETKLVHEPVDLYGLKADDLASLEMTGDKASRRLGEKTAEKCVAELKKRLPIKLPEFIDALGMEGFALETARLLVASGYDTIDKMLAAPEEDLAKIPGLRPGKAPSAGGKAASIVRGLRAREDEIRRLRAAGIEPVTPEQAGPLSGLTFCFTGSSSRPRAELTALVESRGGRVLNSVTKDLAYLVIADPASTSSKAEKARKYGTKLITEETLDGMIAEREKKGASPGEEATALDE